MVGRKKKQTPAEFLKALAEGQRMANAKKAADQLAQQRAKRAQRKRNQGKS